MNHSSGVEAFLGPCSGSIGRSNSAEEAYPGPWWSDQPGSVYDDRTATHTAPPILAKDGSNLFSFRADQDHLTKPWIDRPQSAPPTQDQEFSSIGEVPVESVTDSNKVEKPNRSHAFMERNHKGHGAIGSDRARPDSGDETLDLRAVSNSPADAGHAKSYSPAEEKSPRLPSSLSPNRTSDTFYQQRVLLPEADSENGLQDDCTLLHPQDDCTLLHPQTVHANRRDFRGFGDNPSTPSRLIQSWGNHSHLPPLVDPNLRGRSLGSEFIQAAEPQVEPSPRQLPSHPPVIGVSNFTQMSPFNSLQAAAGPTPSQWEPNPVASAGPHHVGINQHPQYPQHQFMPLISAQPSPMGLGMSRPMTSGPLALPPVSSSTNHDNQYMVTANNARSSQLLGPLGFSSSSHEYVSTLPTGPVVPSSLTASLPPPLPSVVKHSHPETNKPFKQHSNETQLLAAVQKCGFNSRTKGQIDSKRRQQPAEKNNGETPQWEQLSERRTSGRGALKISQLEDIISSNAFISNIYPIARDQAGCRMLQHKLDDKDPEVTNAVFTEVLAHCPELMMDPFGNYLCQKLMESCTSAQLKQILDKVCGSLVTISLNMHGARAVQKLIDVVKITPSHVQRMVSALKDDVVTLTKDPNGNHVIQRCLEALPADSHHFIFEAIASDIIDVASHRHGCRIVQRCVDAAQGRDQTMLTGAICHNALTLAQDTFGNYVVQYVLDLGDPTASTGIVTCMLNRLQGLSRQKFSSNVIECCIKKAGDEDRARMIEELCDSRCLGELLRDVYGNYVVQSSLSMATEPQLVALLGLVRPLLPSLRASVQGRRIAQKLEKKYPALRPGVGEVNGGAANGAHPGGRSGGGGCGAGGNTGSNIGLGGGGANCGGGGGCAGGGGSGVCGGGAGALSGGTPSSHGSATVASGGLGGNSLGGSSCAPVVNNGTGQMMIPVASVHAPLLRLDDALSGNMPVGGTGMFGARPTCAAPPPPSTFGAPGGVSMASMRSGRQKKGRRPRVA